MTALVLLLAVPAFTCRRVRAVFSATTANSSSFTAAANFDAGQIWANGRALGSLVPAQVGTATWAQLTDGTFHNCGIQTDGTLWCWGSNTRGQLGQGDTTYRYDPTKVGSATWTQISAGYEHTCGIQTGGTLWCWGSSLWGQLGQGNQTNLSTPAQVGSATWSQVSTGGYHTCGIQTDASLWCWGYNERGQTGNPATLTDRDVSPFNVTSVAGPWRAVTTGSGHTCAVKTDNTLYCFGDGGDGRLGNNSTANSVALQQVPGTTWLTPYAGRNHTCATKTDNTLSCWGRGTSGQLGDGTWNTSLTPVTVAGAATWKSAGGRTVSTCGLKSDDTIWCWGDNFAGQLGAGDQNARNSPTSSGALTWASLASGFGSQGTCAIRKTLNTLWCWGFTHHQSSTPVAYPGTTYTAVAAGNDFACSVRTDGTLWCWGPNDVGQAGWNLPYGYPKQVTAATTWRTVTAGDRHACGTQTDNTLWCWGYASSGQTGQNNTATQTVPVQVSQAPATSWSAILSAGDNHTCAIKTDNTLWCWGNNSAGQLGMAAGDTTNRLVPVKIGSATWSAVAAGAQQTCGIQTDGSLWCWGSGANGRLGQGDTTGYQAPKQVGTLTTWSRVTAGGGHVCAIQTDGTLWCWGLNSSGQLGVAVGDTTDRPSVTRVGTATSWKSISAGQGHTCGTQTLRTVWCWGQNGYGQLGLGDTINRTVPTQLAGIKRRPITSGSAANTTYAIE
ncbi:MULTISPECIES: chromosome condensation regulator RCC1 [unclassified Actinoplanes]|uniref:RCC1 domain-containing protein n=1 Tax=unclassified Actinoplanes TaxID=2626549 RepID=UPI0012BA6EDD|nr:MULTISPECIES: chromosome condensation regulator RCC1 [unclassified Actinoplanes]